MAEITLEDIQQVVERAIQTQTRQIVREETANIRDEQKRQGVLLEQLEHEVATMSEQLSKNLTVKTKVDDHEERIDEVEIAQRMLVSTVALHSRQLKVS